jgi:uncharacterized protein
MSASLTSFVPAYDEDKELHNEMMSLFGNLQLEVILRPTPSVPIPEEDKELFRMANDLAYAWMTQSNYDPSHNYDHIAHVVSHAKTLLEAEQEAKPHIHFDVTAVFLATLFHDIDDHKYLKTDVDLSNVIPKVCQFLGTSKEFAEKVQSIAHNVSWTKEMKSPESAKKALEKYPEIAIVQDADRLEALGARGIGRCFTYLGATKHTPFLAAFINHYFEKLLLIPDRMKTDKGKQIAQDRVQLLHLVAGQFRVEEDMSNIGFGVSGLGGLEDVNGS